MTGVVSWFLVENLSIQERYHIMYCCTIIMHIHINTSIKMHICPSHYYKATKFKSTGEKGIQMAISTGQNYFLDAPSLWRMGTMSPPLIKISRYRVFANLTIFIVKKQWMNKSFSSTSLKLVTSKVCYIMYWKKEQFYTQCSIIYSRENV